MRVLKRYLITLAVEAVLVLGIVWLKDIFVQTELVTIYHILTDAFCAVGTVTTCAGLLVFSSNEGTFDMFAYGMSSFFDLFRVNSKKKYDTFYDYRASRAEKKLRCGFLMICGLAFLVIAFVMYLLYRQYA